MAAARSPASTDATAHVATPTVARRPERSERRAQLLAAAADLVGREGVASLTMEALAAEAGVSKALPYRHFANAEDALVALYRQELGRLGQEILAASSGLEGDAALCAAIRAYMDAVVERGPLLTVLAGAGSPVPSLAGPDGQPDPTTVATLLAQAYGIGGRRAVALAGVVGGIAVAASDGYGRGDLSRAQAERIAGAAITAAVRSMDPPRPGV